MTLVNSSWQPSVLKCLPDCRSADSANSFRYVPGNTGRCSLYWTTELPFGVTHRMRDPEEDKKEMTGSQHHTFMRKWRSLWGEPFAQSHRTSQFFGFQFLRCRVLHSVKVIQVDRRDKRNDEQVQGPSSETQSTVFLP